MRGEFGDADVRNVRLEDYEDRVSLPPYLTHAGIGADKKEIRSKKVWLIVSVVLIYEHVIGDETYGSHQSPSC